MTYKEFWPFYLTQHNHPTNRNLHALGTILGTSLIIYAISQASLGLVALSFVIGYLFPWIGHFLVEGNRPATFKWPLKSFLSDYRMCFLLLTGKLDAEIKKQLSTHS